MAWDEDLDERQYEINARYDAVNERFHAERLDLEIDAQAGYEHLAELVSLEMESRFIQSGGWEHDLYTQYDIDRWLWDAGLEVVNPFDEVPF